MKATRMFLAGLAALVASGVQAQTLSRPDPDAVLGGWAVKQANCAGVIAPDTVKPGIDAGIVTPTNVYYSEGSCDIKGSSVNNGGFVLSVACDESNDSYDGWLLIKAVGKSKIRASMTRHMLLPARGGIDWDSPSLETYHRCW